MVSVNLILRDNLITKAQGAKEEYELAAQKEIEELNEVEKTLLGLNNGESNNTTGENDNESNPPVEETAEQKIVKEISNLEIGAEYEFNNITWVLINKSYNIAQFVSKTALGNLTLGSGDPLAENCGDIDNDGTSNTPIDKSIYSYNTAIGTINSYCKEFVGEVPTNVTIRSVGLSAEPANPTYYTSTALTNWTEASRSRL